MLLQVSDSNDRVIVIPIGAADRVMVGERAGILLQYLVSQTCTGLIIGSIR